MYSQHGEDDIILKIFGESHIGRFLDVGAWDGKHFSNTWRMTELGWHGVLVEPCPASFMALMNLYAGNERFGLVNAAIGLERRLAVFWQANGDAVSTTDEAHREKWSKIIQFRKMYCSVILWSDLLAVFPGPYDFLDVDVEGQSADLLLGCPLEQVQPRVICVEHDDRADEISAYLEPLGYRGVHYNGTNSIYSR